MFRPWRLAPHSRIMRPHSSFARSRHSVLGACARRRALIHTIALGWALVAGVAAAPAPVEVPDGFEVIVAAGPSLVSYPMLGNFDDRGRLFLAENAGVNFDDKALEQQ